MFAGWLVLIVSPRWREILARSRVGDSLDQGNFPWSRAISEQAVDLSGLLLARQGSCGDRAGRHQGVAGIRTGKRGGAINDPHNTKQRRYDGVVERAPMAGERIERRLAAILAADVAGYSRLIGLDEEGTLTALRSLRRELIDPSIAEHRGRIVKTTGDGVLVEFASVLDALRAAAAVQGEMAARNADTAPERRIEFRIGIHQGDIVVEDGDIFGDGVNIAARLEGIAEPGGICVSARVQEDAAGRLDLDFEDIGDPVLKNIARPV